MKISDAAINESYRLAKKHYEGELSQREAVDQLYNNFGMNRNSAKDYLINFKQMKDGNIYKRCNNAYATDYFLKNLYDDYGTATLRNALNAVNAHVKYYEQLRKTKLRNISELLEKYSKLLNDSTNRSTTNTDAIDDLDAWPEGVSKPEKVNRSVSTYQRNDEVRRTVLSRAKGCCEFCGEEGFLMHDGNRRYLEAHHIIALASDGSDIELAQMPDGTPCGLMIWRDAASDQGLGRPYFWITSTCNVDGMITSISSGFYPSVLSVKRSGIYPGMSPKKLQQLATFRQERLPREQPLFFMLIGYPFSEELEEAEKIVSNALSEFPGSTLAIYNNIDPKDPQVLGQFYRRGINSVPYLIINLNDDQIFRLDGPFDGNTLAKELDLRFSPAKTHVHHQFKLCDDCLERYRKLKHYPESSYYLSILPELPTLIFGDEHPEGGLKAVNHNNQCKDWFHCLFAARNCLWEHGVILDQHKIFWGEAQKLIPDWPGFKRFTLNSDQMVSYQACHEECEEIREILALRNAEISYRCIIRGFVKWMFVLRPNENPGNV